MPYPYKLRKLVKESQVNEKYELMNDTSAFTSNHKYNKVESDIKNQSTTNTNLWPISIGYKSVN